MVRTEYIARYTEPIGENPATPEQVHAYLTAREDMKYAFGLPLDQAVQQYHLPSGQGLYFICDSRVGLHEAETVRELSAPFVAERDKPVLTLFEGSGNTAWGYAEAFRDSPRTRIRGIELDTTVARFARHNVAAAGFSEKVTIEQADAVAALDHAVATQETYRAISLDPPWPIITYTAEALTLDELNPAITTYIQKAVTCAPVVTFHVPTSVTHEHLQTLGRELHHGVIVHSHAIQGQQDAFTTRTAYFVRGSQDYSSTDFVSPQNKTTWSRLRRPIAHQS